MAAAQISLRDVPRHNAQDVAIPQVEWALTPEGNGAPVLT